MRQRSLNVKYAPIVLNDMYALKQLEIIRKRKKHKRLRELLNK